MIVTALFPSNSMVITIPARKLADIWRALPDGADVSVAVEGERAVIRSGRSLSHRYLACGRFSQSGKQRLGCRRDAATEADRSID